MIRIPFSFHVLYSGSPPSLLRIPWGSGEVSVMQSRPYFRVYPLTAVPLNMYMYTCMYSDFHNPYS